LAQGTKTKEISIFDDLQFMLLIFPLFVLLFSLVLFFDGKMNEKWCNQNHNNDFIY